MQPTSGGGFPRASAEELANRRFFVRPSDISRRPGASGVATSLSSGLAMLRRPGASDPAPPEFPQETGDPSIATAPFRASMQMPVTTNMDVEGLRALMMRLPGPSQAAPPEFPRKAGDPPIATARLHPRGANAAAVTTITTMLPTSSPCCAIFNSGWAAPNKKQADSPLREPYDGAKSCSENDYAIELRHEREKTDAAKSKAEGLLALLQEDPKLKSDRAFIIEVLQHQRQIDYVVPRGDRGVGWDILSQVPQDSVSILGDQEIVRMAVLLSNGGCALGCAVDELRGDRELVRFAIAVGPFIGRHDTVMGVHNDFSAFAFASEELQGDRDLALEAVQLDAEMFEHASEEVQADREVARAAIQQSLRQALPAAHFVFSCASTELRADRALALEAVQVDGEALDHASEEIQADRDVVRAAIQEYGEALMYASLQLRADREMVLAAISTCGEQIRLATKKEVKWYERKNSLKAILKHMSEDLVNDHEIIMHAVQFDGNSLLMASPTLQLDPCILGTAMKGLIPLGRDFQTSTMKTLYVKTAVVLRKELEGRGAPELLVLALMELVLEGPTSINALSHQWWKDRLENLFLTGIIGSRPMMVEVTMGGILGYSGLKEDLVVATQLKSFGTLLGHLGEGGLLSSFKECVNQETERGE